MEAAGMGNTNHATCEKHGDCVVTYDDVWGPCPICRENARAAKRGRKKEKKTERLTDKLDAAKEEVRKSHRALQKARLMYSRICDRHTDCVVVHKGRVKCPLCSAVTEVAEAKRKSEAKDA
jgi:uncharacterized Zn finger protein (UPF0148 family)